MYIGDFIKKYRQEHEMSMQDFANLTGLSKAYVGMLEKIYNPTTKQPISPSIDKMNQIANGIGMSLDDLLSQLDGSQPIMLRPQHKTTPTPTGDETLPEITFRDERQIAKELEAMMNALDNRTGFAAHGGTVEDEEDRELLRASLFATLKLAKQIAKKKFTPKNFRK